MIEPFDRLETEIMEEKPDLDKVYEFVATNNEW